MFFLLGRNRTNESSQFYRSKSHNTYWRRNVRRLGNKVSGKQIEFNKNRSPEANYDGRELDKLFAWLYKVQTFLVFAMFCCSIRFKEMQQNIIGSTTPFRMIGRASALTRRWFGFDVYLKNHWLNLQRSQPHTNHLNWNGEIKQKHLRWKIKEINKFKNKLFHLFFA